MLTTTTRRSYQLIWVESKGRFSNARKPRRSSKSRTELDHKTKAEPKKERVSRRGQSMPQLEKAREIVRPLMDAGKPFQCHDLEKEHGISHYTFDSAICAEKARIETLAQLLDAAAAAKFSDKGELRIEDAIRVHKARLDRAFEQRVNEEVRRRIAAADDATRASNKELRAEVERLTRAAVRGRIFTMDEYKAIRRCTHPDTLDPETGERNLTPERMNRAFDLLESKKFALTGEK